MGFNLQELSDRAEINDVLMRYLRGIDGGDHELVRSCFHTDARFEFAAAFAGDIDLLLENIRTHSPTYKRTFHLAGNVLIELDGDTAQTETYVAGFEETSDVHPLGAGVFLTIWLRYLDRFERRDSTWRIAERRAVFDWRRQETTEGFAALPPAEKES